MFRKIVMNRQRVVTIVGAVTGLAISTATLAAGQSSTNYAIPRDVINNGVADMSSTNFRLSSSVGDAVTNKIYVANSISIGNVSVIDGAT